MAVIELDRQALLNVVVGYVGGSESSEVMSRPVATTDVAWTELPTEYNGLAYEALQIVYDAASQWRRAVWMDGEVLDGFGALPSRLSRCLVRGTDYVWETDHTEFGRLRTDPIGLIDVMKGMLYVGEPTQVRAMCETMSKLCPEVLATALRAGVGPRFGVAHGEVTKRSIADLVGPEEIRPLLFHEEERVRRVALDVLGLEDAPPG